ARAGRERDVDPPVARVLDQETLRPVLVRRLPVRGMAADEVRAQHHVRAGGDLAAGQHVGLDRATAQDPAGRVEAHRLLQHRLRVLQVLGVLERKPATLRRRVQLRMELALDLRVLGQQVPGPVQRRGARLVACDDERHHLFGQLARGPGTNRDKLTRGFRELYNCTVAEALSERRLGQAQRMLAASDLPVASIGYRCGYLNNASFTRAFSRRFGMAPTEMRRVGIAA
ncbi:MAG: helix-turn-helix transcriptional regulator, partial [Sphingopyxis sp.]|nr:helix-turn-helix transcriptional regulator [Sphingopyxis sp.]